MAKIDSTAVNELIDLVQGSKPMADGTEDAMFSAPKPKPNPPRVSGPMSSTLQGAAAVPSLPRARTPNGTSQHSLPKLPPPVPVRMHTAPPSRSATIPPLPKTSSPDLPPVARSSRPSMPPPARTSPPPPRTSPPPASAPVAAPFEAKPAPPRIPEALPVVAPPPAHLTIDKTGDVVSAEGWFEPSRMVEKVDESWHSGTLPVQRRYNTVALAKKLAVPTAIALVVGVMIGGFLVFNGEGGKKRNHVKAPTKVAVAAEAASPPSEPPAPASPEAANAATATAGAEQPQPPPANAGSVIPAATAAAISDKPSAPAPEAPAAAPVAPAPSAQAVESTPAPIQEVKTARGVVKLANVRIDTKPSGATVMLVDNGKTSFLGTTPVAASLDPSRAYDVILTLEGRPTQMAHLDPTKTRHVEVSLGKAVAQIKAAAPAPAPAAEVAAPAPAHHHHHDVKPATAAATVDASLDTPSEDKPADKPVEKPPAATGQGTLMISSKPPCEIVIDGKPTGLTTPQRSIPLAAGAHKITLVNGAENLRKTVAVAITANQSTKLIQDMMSK